MVLPDSTNKLKKLLISELTRFFNFTHCDQAIDFYLSNWIACKIMSIVSYLFTIFSGGDSSYDVHRTNLRSPTYWWPRSRHLFAWYQKGRWRSPCHVLGPLIYNIDLKKKEIRLQTKKSWLDARRQKICIWNQKSSQKKIEIKKEKYVLLLKRISIYVKHVETKHMDCKTSHYRR